MKKAADLVVGGFSFWKREEKMLGGGEPLASKKRPLENGSPQVAPR